MATYVRETDKSHMVTVNIKEPAQGANPAEDFEVCLIPAVDLVFYSARDNASTSDIAVYNRAYYENVNKPIAAYFQGTGISATAKAFFDNKGSLLFIGAGFGENRISKGMFDLGDKDNIAGLKSASEAALGDSKPIPLAPMGAVKVDPGTETAEITVTAPGNPVVEIMYGQSFPLKNSTGPKQVSQDAKADFTIEGLTAGNEYLYYIRIKGADTAFVSKPAKFRTMSYKPLTALPFHMSDNFIKAKGTSFYDGKNEFRYVGTNCYYMRHDEIGRAHV
jgi:hypothetical protein